jgi:chemotaxis response regulator CheB
LIDLFAGERSALLASIQSFNKSKLKKTVTVDKSKPVITKSGENAPRGAVGVGVSGGGGTALRAGNLQIPKDISSNILLALYHIKHSPHPKRTSEIQRIIFTFIINE